MWLYLVHHGDAVGPDVDPLRPLSPEGRLVTERLARDAAARGASPQAVWHSGKLRARQTAELFWRSCNPLAGFTAVRGLQPTDPPEWLRDAIAAEASDVMVVGHMPHLDRLLNTLVPQVGSQSTVFPQHGVVALERDNQLWLERWRIQP